MNLCEENKLHQIISRTLSDETTLITELFAVLLTNTIGLGYVQFSKMRALKERALLATKV